MMDRHKTQVNSLRSGARASSEYRLRSRGKTELMTVERAVELNIKPISTGVIAWRDALLDNLKKAQTAYDDACKAYEEAKAAADTATSPEITKPTETTPPSGSTQPAEATPPVSLTCNRQRRRYQAPPSRRTRAAASKQIRPPASSRTRATQRRAQSHSQQSPPQASE